MNKKRKPFIFVKIFDLNIKVIELSDQTLYFQQAPYTVLFLIFQINR